MEIEPIGVIHSPFKTGEEAPHQPIASNSIGRIEIFKEYEEGLSDIEGFSHIILIFAFHRSEGYSLKVKTPHDENLKGVFATRSPNRPNRLGLSIVRLLTREKNILFVEGIDAIDGTPLIDIKPYVPNLEPKTGIRIGWLEGKIEKKS